MKRVYCEKEMEILEALRHGPLHPELTKHAANCDICADTLAVSEFLQTDRSVALTQQSHSERSASFAPWIDLRGEESWLNPSTSTANENTQFCAGLPDSDFLWWKAQLARKKIAVERATRSIALVRRVSYLGAVAAGLWLVLAPGHLGPILSVLSRHEIFSSGILGQSALFLSAAALVFTLLGSLYLAHPEQ